MRYQQPTVAYNNEPLQSVDNFTYLGVNFSKSNSFTKGLKERSQQIYQSQSVLDLHTLKHPSASAFHTFELFDTLLKTKLLYGCEIWGTGNYEALELYHTRFIKRTLGVKSSTNTSMIFAETGRSSSYTIDVNIQIIKYWVKISRSAESSYIKLVYSEMFQNLIKYEWIRYVKNLLCSSGFSGIWEQQFVQDERKFIKQFDQRSKAIYI